MTSANNPSQGYQPTSTNMVQIIDNVIKGYKMGSLRALAQEPVQNSKDASLDGQTVKVEYRLHRRTLADGTQTHMLTITDSGTKGLGGDFITQDEIDRRGGTLPIGADWAAFEGQGYTKTDQDALGSRGQGKSAFLFHSEPPNPSDHERRRMVIIYDTLLPDNQYRLGVRYASPRDTAKTPPYQGNEARQQVSSADFCIDEDLIFPLCLEPLTQPGSRIIVPYLREEAVDAFRNRELEKWLEMCWWRALQTGELQIQIVDEHDRSRSVKIPKWWRNQFWGSGHEPSGTYVVRNLEIPNHEGMKIKRIVLLNDDDLAPHKHLYDDDEPEYDGVQLMRGRQWIETLGIKQSSISSFISSEHRDGFRGFVEFDKKLDQELRSDDYERPQHDGYDRRRALIRDIIRTIADSVKEFSEQQGWLDEEPSPEEVSKRERDIAQQFLNAFVNPSNPVPPVDGRDNAPGGTRWNIDLRIDYPQERTTRVNWGEKVSNISASCETEPARNWGSVVFELQSVDTEGKSKSLKRERAYMKEDGSTSVRFPDIAVLKGTSNNPHMHCPIEGRYSLRTVLCEYEGEESIAKASRSVYVQDDPPEVAPKPIVLSVNAKNLEDPERRRINHGEKVRIEIVVTNRGIDDRELVLDAVLAASALPGNLVEGIDAPRSLQLADRKKFTARGTARLGDTHMPTDVYSGSVKLLNDLPLRDESLMTMTLAPGVHHLRVDLYDAQTDEIIANASRQIFFEQDLKGATGELPFELKRQETMPNEDREASPSWWMKRPENLGEPYTLYYSPKHHLYKIAEKANEGTRNKKWGSVAFIREICADALLDWMHEPYSEGNDDSRYRMISDMSERSPRHRRLSEQIDQFKDIRAPDIESTDTLSEHRRKIVANMVRILEEGDA